MRAVHEQVRAAEQDPRGAEQLEAARSAMAGLDEGAPDVTDLTVIAEWAEDE